MKRYEELLTLVQSLEADFTKFYDEANNAAGTRIRKGMQNLKGLAQEVRVEITTIKNQA